MKKRLCFVIQRYGKEVNGGAEAYTKMMAEKLSEFYEITVLTTCALDYSEWRNYYPEGSEIINDVLVHRFKCDRKRNTDSFSSLCSDMFGKEHSAQEADEWIKEQGPVSSALINFIRNNQGSYDLFLFFTYLYYPTVFGMREAEKKSVLIPFCHDEPPVYMKCFDRLFSSPLGIIFNTDEEEDFVRKRFDIKKIPSVKAGIGIDISTEKYDIKEKPYILYMGRVDEAKGCHELFSYFEEYKKREASDINLMLIGKEAMKVPKKNGIISCGFVSEEEKYRILSECTALILPSHYESLSIVVLEAFAFSKPVLVSGHSEVLKGHCLKSNGGLYFYGKEDFCECLNVIMHNHKLRRGLGINGQKYVSENYKWEDIIKRISTFIDSFLE